MILSSLQKPGHDLLDPGFWGTTGTVQESKGRAVARLGRALACSLVFQR